MFHIVLFKKKVDDYVENIILFEPIVIFSSDSVANHVNDLIHYSCFLQNFQENNLKKMLKRKFSIKHKTLVLICFSKFPNNIL